MTEDRLQTILESFYRSTALTPPDPSRSLEEVMARVPQTRQRGRCWPLPSLGRASVTPPAIPSTAFRPTPMPATTGHVPTITGRTYTMFSPVKAIVTGAVVFALGGVFLIAQPFDQQGGVVPGAPAASTPAVAVHVSGTDGDPTFLIDPTQVRVGDVTQFRGGLFTQTSSMDDPRVSGELTFTWSGDVYGVPFVDAATEWGTMRIANESGTWEGPCSGGQWGDTTSILSCWLPGSGDYEGLTYYRQFDWPPEVGVRGVIFPGVPPTEFPALPASVSE